VVVAASPHFPAWADAIGAEIGTAYLAAVWANVTVRAVFAALFMYYGLYKTPTASTTAQETVILEPLLGSRLATMC
jgi:hypothetical protein